MYIDGGRHRASHATSWKACTKLASARIITSYFGGSVMLLCSSGSPPRLFSKSRFAAIEGRQLAKRKKSPHLCGSKLEHRKGRSARRGMAFWRGKSSSCSHKCRGSRKLAGRRKEKRHSTAMHYSGEPALSPTTVARSDFTERWAIETGQGCQS